MERKPKPADGTARKKRRHTPKQLIERPITIYACSGPVVVGAEIVAGVAMVQLSYPGGLTVEQPPPRPAPGASPDSTSPG